MSTIIKKGIGANEVDDTKIRLRNNQSLRGRNAADTADIEIVKINTSGKPEFTVSPVMPTPSSATDAASKGYVDDLVDDYVPLTQKGANNGVATLDSGGKIPASQLPNSVMELQGGWNASTNTPTLADGTGNAGDVYEVTVAGTQNLGSGNITFAVGDWVVYGASAVWYKSASSGDVTSVNSQTGTVVLDTDDISEGATNLYYTTGRAQGDAVQNSLSPASTVKAPSVDAVNAAVNAKEATLTAEKTSFTLTGTDITNQYVDLSHVAKANTVRVYAFGVYQIQGVDYSISTPSNTRITFAGNLATGGSQELVATDVLYVEYLRN